MQRIANIGHRMMVILLIGLLAFFGRSGPAEYGVSVAQEVAAVCKDGAGHAPGEAATCMEPQLCAVCGAVLESALGHSYSAEIVAPTCDRMGFTIYTCQLCGDRYRADYTDPVGHRYVPYYFGPICTDGGYTTYICANCGDSYSVRTAAPLGHDWVAAILKERSSTEDGLTEYTCARCGEKYSVTVPATDSQNRGHVDSEG